MNKGKFQKQFEKSVENLDPKYKIATLLGKVVASEDKKERLELSLMIINLTHKL